MFNKINPLFRQVTEHLNNMQIFKGRRYGDAWKKRGEHLSIFPKVAQKFDRLEKIMMDDAEGLTPLPPPESEESVAETVGDLATYCILWLTHIAETRPAEFRAWQERCEKMQKVNDEFSKNEAEPV